MKSDIATDGPSRECYLLQIDGETTSQYRLFVEALKAALELKKTNPLKKIKVCEA